MYNYRITKYNPIYRPIEGGYTNDEWTEVCDIGNFFNGMQFTASEYYKMEDKYWQTIEYLLNLCNIKKLKVIDLYNRRGLHDFFTEDKYFFASRLQDTMQDKKNIGLPEIEMVLRLCLRHDIWCNLEKDGGTYIHFGYDYYMFFGTNVDHVIDPAKIPDGIFIENFKSPDME